MKEVRKELTLKVYDSFDELSSDDQSLMHLAIDQLKCAYAPYSRFLVGSALRLKNGSKYVGSNQENASYPLCMCGERVAIYNAASNEPNEIIEIIAITAKNLQKALDQPISPCGACRQVLLEFEIKQNYPIQIILKADSSKVYHFSSAKDLLPFSFDGSFL